MTRFGASLSLLLAIMLSTALVAADKASLYDVGSQRQLLIDKAFFDQSHNIRLRLHPARKTGEIVLKREHPWESATLNWFSVIQDAGVVDKEAKYRMWYECYDVPGWPTSDDTSFCYAESRDGMHWTKPSLGLVEYQGSKSNNISVPPARAGGCAFASPRNGRLPGSWGSTEAPLQGRFSRHLARENAAAPDRGDGFRRRPEVDPLLRADLRHSGR